jgi:DNA (cytosine-5)-methyltransferase 1
MNVLNLYAGIGGNRVDWPATWNITAVEIDTDIAKIYVKRFPADTLIVGDALKYCEKHFAEFDFIWSSPPCPTHGQYRHNVGVLAKGYAPIMPDMSLYAQIIFLKQYAPKWWLVENVKPYYEPLIAPTVILQRHLAWSNLPIKNFKAPASKIRSRNSLDSFDDLADFVKGTNIRNKRQVLRNCVSREVSEYVAQVVEQASSASPEPKEESK